MKKITILLMTIAMIIVFAIPAYADSINSLSATINSSKVVTVTGSVYLGSSGKQVTIRIIDPKGNLEYINQTISGASGNFTFTYTMLNTVQGSYIVNVGGESITSPKQATFTVATSTGGGSSGGGDGGTTPTPAPTPISTPIPVPTTTLLTDITNNWAKTDIEFLVDKGIISGYTNGTFRPEQNITRGEFITLLAKASGLEPSKDISSLNKFKDFKNMPDWAKPTVATAVYTKILTGFNDNTLRLDSKISRVEIVVLLSKILNSENNDTTSFKDNDKIPSWANDAVSKAVSAGIVKGYPDDTFKPQGLATRAETATMIAIYFRQK